MRQASAGTRDGRRWSSSSRCGNVAEAAASSADHETPLRRSCKEITWFLGFAFVSFVILPDFADAEIVPSQVNTSVAVGIEPSLPEDNSGKYTREIFSVSKSLQFAQTNESQNVIKEESRPDQAAGQESTAEKTKKGGGLSTGTVIAIIGGIVLIAVVIIAIAAANSGPDVGNINLGGGR